MAKMKRCPRCAQLMRMKEEDAWYECHCGNAWVKGRGHFMVTPDMTIRKTRRTDGRTTSDVIEISSSLPGVEPMIYAIRPGVTGGTPVPMEPEESQEAREKRLNAYEVRNATNLVRGGIYYISKHLSEGSETRSGRPGIVLSNSWVSGLHTVVSVVYLTTRAKKPTETRVPIKSSGVDATALCETITSVDVSKVGDAYGFCTAEEMAAVKKAIATYLDLQEEIVKPGNISQTQRIIKLEAANAALEDQLREVTAQLRNERDRKGCSCCNGDEAVHWDDENNNVFIDSKGNMDIMVHGHTMVIKVKKCPVCGRWFDHAKEDASD